MGSGQSARKLTITNDEELGVIHISNGVAQRLAQGVAGQKAKGNADGPDTRIAGQWEASPIQQQAGPTPQVQSAPPYYSNPAHIHPEYTISALKMQQQKEEELGNQNLYWQKRMENLKNSHARVDRILEEEYKRAVDQVASVQGKKKIDINSVVPPCIENKDKVLQCYQDHPREILKCSSLVEEFSNCVDQRRAGLIAARC